MVKRHPTTITKKVIFPLLKRRKTINNNIGLRKETFEFLSCDVKLHLNYRQHWIRKVRAQLKANTDTLSNYVGSKRASSRRSVQERRYRPISLITVPGKAASNQHGFSKGRSCLTTPFLFMMHGTRKGPQMLCIFPLARHNTSVSLSPNW